MTSPTLALIWELWRRGRLGVGLLLAFAAVSLAVSQYSVLIEQAAAAIMTPPAGAVELPGEQVAETYARASFWRETATITMVVLYLLSFLVVCALFTRVEPSPARGFTGMPSRLFTLPVSSTLLAAVPVGLGIVGMTVLWWGWEWFLFPRVFLGGGGWPNLYLNLFQVAWLVTLQAIVWALPGFPYSRIVLLTALGFGAVGGVIAGVFEGRAWDPRDPRVLTGLVAWTVLAAGAATAGVAMTRRGCWQGWNWLVRVWDQVTAWFAWRRYFHSGASAQFWLEFRRTGWAAFGVLAAWDCLFLAVTDFWGRQTQGNELRLFFQLQWVFILLPWTAVVGTFVALDPASRRPALGAFSGTRPLATRELFLAKLWALIAIWGCGVVGSLVLTFQFFLMTGHVDSVRAVFLGTNGFLDPSWVLATVGSFNLLVGLLPFWLTGRLPGVPWSFLVVGLAYTCAGVIFADLLTPDASVGGIRRAILPLLLFAKLGTAIVAFRQSCARGLLSGRFVLGWVSLWFVATSGLLAYVYYLLPHDGIRSENEIATSALVNLVVLSFPLARIGLAPLALAANRHR